MVTHWQPTQKERNSQSPKWVALDTRTALEELGGTPRRKCSWSFRDNNARFDLFAIWLKHVYGSRRMSFVYKFRSFSGWSTPRNQLE